MWKERPGEGSSQATVSLEDTLPTWLSMTGAGAGAAGLVRLSASLRLFSRVAAWCLCNPPVTEVMESHSTSCSEVFSTGKALLTRSSLLYQSIRMPSLEALAM